MNKKTFVGLFDTDASLIEAMHDLDKKGVDPEDMYVIARKEEDVDMLRRKAFEDIQSAPSNWLDRFIGYISGENHVRSMLVEIGFDEADLRRYEAEIKQGKLLLYVDGEVEKTAFETNAARYKEETNPFGHTLSEGERLNQNDEDEAVGLGKDGLPKNEYRDSVVTDANGDWQERDLIGLVGAEALIDKTGYEGTISPSRVRGTPQKDRQNLHRLSRMERDDDTSNLLKDALDRENERESDADFEQSEINDRTSNRENNRASRESSSESRMTDLGSFMESQMDRQDAIVEPASPPERYDAKNSEFRYTSEEKEPIIIDLRNVAKMDHDARAWLYQDKKDWEK